MPTDSDSQASGPQASAPAFRRPQVSPPQPLEIEGDRADNWKIWKQRWENYCIITGLNNQPEDYKCAILLHSIGISAILLRSSPSENFMPLNIRMASIPED